MDDRLTPMLPDEAERIFAEMLEEAGLPRFDSAFHDSEIGELQLRWEHRLTLHTVVITASRADHYPGTNHEAGRAMDIGAVDGEICRGARFGACAELVRELGAVTGPTRSTELIYCWDPDGPLDPRGFARADHCDHIHWGLDA